ncbi:hypothetical protein BC826DRAFT_965517 [Russula brevipes]|nr:hypothetical protein BC826DRAFT_965517 [Russula brevipes]
MSGSLSLSTEPSYDGGQPGYPLQSDTPSTPDQRTPTQAAEHSPEYSLPRSPDAMPDTQPDNRLSVVSAVSLEPRRRSRHHHSRHSHIHRELAHMLSISARDAKELRRGLNAAFDKLDQSRARASDAEKLALDMLLRVREAETERTNAMCEASTVREELGKYKALLDNAHGEIRRAQHMLQDQEDLRYEAEASAARARDNARQVKQRRVIDLAREQGRKMGYKEGIEAGQRFGYHEGQSPIEDDQFYPNEGPRFREIFESRYRLDEFDQSPPFRDTYLNPSFPLDTEGPLPTPLPRRQVYPRLQGQLGEPSRPTNGAVNTLPEAPYSAMSTPRGVQRTSSTDSSSTTTLPAAPTSQHVSARAPPPMPTIPEVPSTELGSVSWTSRSPKDSPGAQYAPTPLIPQEPTYSGVVSPRAPFFQGGAGFQPPPGIMEETPSGLVGGYAPESRTPVYQSPSPHRAFDDPSILNNAVIPDVSWSPVHENFSTSAGAQIPAREHFEPPPGVISSPLQERFTTTPPHSPRATRSHTDSAQLRDPRATEFSSMPTSRPYTTPSQSAKGLPQRDGLPRRRPTPQMPAPLAPQSSPNASYTYGHNSTAQPRSTSQIPAPLAPQSSPNAPYTYGHNGTAQPRPTSQMPASLSPQSSASASYAYGPHSTAQPRPTSQMPAPLAPQSSANAPHAHGPQSTAQRYPTPQMPAPLASQSSVNAPHAHGPQSTARQYPTPQMPAPAPQSSAGAPYAMGAHSTVQRHPIPQMPASALQSSANASYTHVPPERNSAGDRLNRIFRCLAMRALTPLQTVPLTGRDPLHRSYQVLKDVPYTNMVPEQRAHALSPRTSGERPLSPDTTHDPRLAMSPRGMTSDSMAGQPTAPRNPPRVQVQIPPTRYHGPSSASPHLATSPARTYVPRSPGATSPNSGIHGSNLANRSPLRYPPTLYDEPNLQRQPTITVDYEQGGRAASPALPVPSRDPWASSPRSVAPPADAFGGSSYDEGQRTAITSPYSPADTLPVRPPSVSPRPSPGTFVQQVPPPQGAASSTRPVSPNPLPRGTSPAPLPRASSPAPLPIRSPSVRSARIHRSRSDVSIPGAPGSQYTHYDPNEEADISVLASSSASKLAAANR